MRLKSVLSPVSHRSATGGVLTSEYPKRLDFLNEMRAMKAINFVRPDHARAQDTVVASTAER